MKLTAKKTSQKFISKHDDKVQFCLLFSFATAIGYDYAKCEFPGTEQGNGIIMFKQTGNKIIGRSNFRFNRGWSLIKLKFLKKMLQRNSCARLQR